MKKWVECVPNFSEGKNRDVIDDIAASISSTPDVHLLHVDSGIDVNRTVMTFVGSPKGVLEAGFKAIETASKRIDMRKHAGLHRRIGATDVFPFVPVENMTFEECILLAKQLASRVATQLHIPIYLYGLAASKSARTGIPSIRKGGYETLRKRIQTDEFKPDFGDRKISETAGATIIGVRNYLLAYNVNLLTENPRHAKDIARALRSSGRKMRNEDRSVKRDDAGHIVRIPGELTACQADGWYLPTFGVSQVTMNLLDYEKTGLHTAFEAVKNRAAKRGITVGGSELIGMVPKKALLDAGTFFLRQEGKDAFGETELIAAASRRLGLSAIAPFDPQTRIIELALSKAAKKHR